MNDTIVFDWSEYFVMDTSGVLNSFQPSWLKKQFTLQCYPPHYRTIDFIQSKFTEMEDWDELDTVAIQSTNHHPLAMLSSSLSTETTNTMVTTNTVQNNAFLKYMDNVEDDGEDDDDLVLNDEFSTENNSLFPSLNQDQFKLLANSSVNKLSGKDDAEEDWDASFTDDEKPVDLSRVLPAKSFSCITLNDDVETLKKPSNGQKKPQLITMDMFNQQNRTFTQPTPMPKDPCIMDDKAPAFNSKESMASMIELDVDLDIPVETSFLRMRTPPKMESTADAFVLDDIPDLKIEPSSILSPPLSGIQQHFNASGHQLNHSGNATNKRYLASPVPSSAASMIASECDEEGYDDILFPDYMDAKSYNALKEKKMNSLSNSQTDVKPMFQSFADTEKVKKENEEEMGVDGLDIPQNFDFEAKIKQHRNISPSKIPRLVAPISFTSSPNRQSSTLSEMTNAILQSLPPNVSTTPHHASVQEMLYASAQWFTQRRIASLNSNILGNSSSTNNSDAGAISFLTQPKNAKDYGDGNELDDIDDLEVKEHEERKYLKTSKNTRPSTVKNPQQRQLTSRVPSAPVPKTQITSALSGMHFHSNLSSPVKMKQDHMSAISRSVGSSSRETRFAHVNGTTPLSGNKLDNSLGRRLPISAMPNVHAMKKAQKPKKKPTLIRNLNVPETAKVVGGMTYNPKLQRWEGNDEMMNEFERALYPSGNMTPARRPILIQNMGGSKHVQKIGDMVFDPVKMCWVGNDEDVDIFAECTEQEPNTMTNTQKEKRNGSEFILSKQMMESFYIAESTHKLFIGRWYPRIVTDTRTVMRDASKTHLYEIRHII